MACVGTRGSGFRGSALGRRSDGRTSVDCMLPRPPHRESGAAPAPPKPGRGALSGAREQRGPAESGGVQHGELNSIACSL